MCGGEHDGVGGVVGSMMKMIIGYGVRISSNYVELILDGTSFDSLCI